jgi:DHA1 family bicyclomycin/chloramphenicol resistance-like MFS transporter
VPRSPARALVPFFASTFAWNLALGMTHVLIPLYAYHLGYSGVEIGSLVSAPVVAQIAFNMIGGAWTDRIGGKRLALFSCGMLGIGGTVFAFASTFPTLLFAQLCVIVSRSVFWPATWALGSQLPGDRSVQMGRLNSITSAGQIVGTVAAGLAIVHVGFAAGFGALAAFGGIVAMALMAAFAAPAHRAPEVAQPIFATYRRLARKPSIWFALATAYMAGLPFSLSFSFYPILLVAEGFSSDEAGWMISLRALGSVFAGVTAARFVRKVTERSIPVGSAFATALTIVGVALFAHAAPISACLFAVGLSSGVLTLYFQLLASEISTPETRGSTLAISGFGWALSHLTTPFAMGVLTDAFGIHAAFYAFGTAAVVGSLGLAPLHAWAFRGGRPR